MLEGNVKLPIRNLKLSPFSCYSFRFKLIFTPRKRARNILSYIHILGGVRSCDLMEDK